MPKRTGSQGYIAAGEVVGEVVQLTGKLSRWRVSPPSPPHTHILTRPHPPTCTSLSLALTPHRSPRPPRTHLAHLANPNPNQVSHGRQPGAECVSQARDQAAVEAVEGARQRWGQCGRRVMRGATVTTPRPPPTWCCHVFCSHPSAAPVSPEPCRAGRLSTRTTHYSPTAPCRVHCRRGKSVEAPRMVPRVGPPPTPRFVSRPPANRLAAGRQSAPHPTPSPLARGWGPPPPRLHRAPPDKVVSLARATEGQGVGRSHGPRDEACDLRPEAGSTGSPPTGTPHRQAPQHAPKFLTPTPAG